MSELITLDGHQVDPYLIDRFYDGHTGRRVTDVEWDETVRRIRYAEQAETAGRTIPRTAVRFSAGALNLFDGVDLTAASEYASRLGEKIDTLQIHHATTTSFSGLKSLMDPGGRTVSANGAMSNTGILHEVVPLAYRAFTSASGYDRRCLTVEVCNTTLSPLWGISDVCHERLAQLAVAMFEAGILGSLTRKHIIEHNEVPGTYPTACAGPSMDTDRIVRRANQIKQEREDEELMASLDDATIKRLADATAKAVWDYPLKNNVNSRPGPRNPEGLPKLSAAETMLRAAHEDGYDAVNGKGIKAQVLEALTEAAQDETGQV